MKVLWQGGLRTITSAAESALNRVLPHRCGLCDAESQADMGLCGTCFGKLAFIAQPACPGCARPLEQTQAGRTVQYCGVCLRDGAAFEHAVAALRYDDAVGQIVLKFKHGDRLDLAPLIAKWMAQAWNSSRAPQDIDYIVPVPLHWRRQVARRYNQSLELAKRLNGLGGGTLRPELVVRQRATAQMFQMNRTQRRKNVSGAFRILDQGRKNEGNVLKGKHVLLIDDVYTTGSTLRAVAGTLIRAHVAKVSILVAARVIREDA